MLQDTMVNTGGLENGMFEPTNLDWMPSEPHDPTNKNIISKRPLKTGSGMTCYLAFVSSILIAIVVVLIVYFFYINLKLSLGL